jgi:hypothetical protein
VYPSTGAVASLAPRLTSESGVLVATPPWWPSVLPSPELTAAVLLGTLVCAVVVVVIVVRVVVPSGVRVVRLLRRGWRRVTPKSTFGRVIVIFVLLFVVATAPTMWTMIGAKGMIRDVGSGTGMVAEMDDDTIGLAAGGTTKDRSEIRVVRPGPDRDGDGLHDAWERAGETPGGAPLPGADPDRKDLYLQVVYGADVESLSAAERASLRDIWAGMPVRNPDGSTGVSLHLVDERRLDESVRVYEPGEERLGRHYAEEMVDGGACHYYQTTFGEITQRNKGGRGALGGYVSMVDATETTVRNGRSDRVAFLTHELLHNTAGAVDGQAHTPQGWLATVYDGSNPTLSNATAAELEDGFAARDDRCERRG